jgi:hypothetical protein
MFAEVSAGFRVRSLGNLMFVSQTRSRDDAHKSALARP